MPGRQTDPGAGPGAWAAANPTLGNPFGKPANAGLPPRDVSAGSGSVEPALASAKSGDFWDDFMTVVMSTGTGVADALDARELQRIAWGSPSVMPWSPNRAPAQPLRNPGLLGLAQYAAFFGQKGA